MLTELRLSEMGGMTDEWLTPIASLMSLTRLELASPGTSLTDEAVNKFLGVIGPNLHILDFSGNNALTDEVLLEGIGKHCHTLTSLALRGVPELSDLGVTKFFDEWTNPSLGKLDLSQCPNLASRALDAVIKHSGETLISLSINGWKEVAEETLTRLAGTMGRTLTELDMSWCREVDNFVIKDLVEKCPNLKWVKCYGCNKLTEACPTKVRGFAVPVVPVD
jgi:DNA repair protein RAD7